MAASKALLRLHGAGTWKNLHQNISTSNRRFDVPGPPFKPPYKPKCSVVHWRISNGLPASGREYGPLTDRADWSYADGRAAPLGLNAKLRINKNIEYCKNIIKCTKEIDAAVELTARLKADEEKKRLYDIENRLKSKVKC